MSLNKDKVSEIASLAMLSLTDEQLKSNTKELNKIFDLFTELSQLNVDDVSPMTHPININQRLLEDKVVDKDKSKEFQAIAPKTKDRYYLVPKVIE
jgi:aspartyl-tRNA(Asn)/glutamyl-tRNA(Gln) amidotransferase subunit C